MALSVRLLVIIIGLLCVLAVVGAVVVVWALTHGRPKPDEFDRP
jgi:hypothetical protein